MANKSKLQDMRLKAEYTDVKLYSKFGTKPFNVHKIILVSASPYFEKLFAESKETTVRLDFSEQIVRTVLDYIYLENNATIYVKDLDQAEDLLQAASILEMTRHFSKCCTKVECMLTAPAEDFVRIASWNKVYANEYTGQLLDNYAETFSSDILQFNLHLAYDLDNFRLLLKYRGVAISTSEVYAISAIRGIIKWVKAHRNKRERHIASLFSSLTIRRLSTATAFTLLSEEMINTNSQVLMHLFRSYLEYQWR